MKNAQQEEAKDLYFQTNMSNRNSKYVGVKPRTILRWCAQDNWENFGSHPPYAALVAENVTTS